MKKAVMVNVKTILVIGLLAVSFAGCNSSTGIAGKSISTADFNQYGIPNARYQIGGGMEIDFTAPQAGTFYYVELTSQAILFCKHLKANEKYKLDSDEIGDIADDYIKHITDVFMEQRDYNNKRGKTSKHDKANPSGQTADVQAHQNAILIPRRVTYFVPTQTKKK